jgi:5-methylcytosine-specific restriction protein A
MTRTFLLTWHPGRWPWADLVGALDDVSTAGIVHERWSVGNRRDLPPGSRLFLMRLGEDPKGLVGSGWSTSAPAQGPHWDDERARGGDVTWFVSLDLDVLQEAPVIDLDVLTQPPFDSVSWTPQSSGVEIPAPVAEALESVWAQRTAGPAVGVFIDAVPTGAFPEGALRRISVNSYERDERARRACIAHYGSTCVVCSFSFPAVYGDAFRDFIHVHHLRPVSELGTDYLIDPIRDLRPVCPNCHAAIHRRRPPFTVEELRALLAARHGSA